MKHVKSIMVAAVLLLLGGVFLAGCGNNSSISGKWEVSSYIIDGKSYSTKDVLDTNYFSRQFEFYNKYTLTFHNNGTVVYERYDDGEKVTVTADYSVEADQILITIEDESVVLPYSGDEIILEIDTGTQAIMKK